MSDFTPAQLDEAAELFGSQIIDFEQIRAMLRSGAAALRMLEGLREWLIRRTCEASDIMVAASLSIDTESFDVAHVTHDTLSEVLMELMRAWPALPDGPREEQP